MSFKKWLDKNKFCTADIPPSADKYLGTGCSDDCINVIPVQALGEWAFRHSKELMAYGWVEGSGFFDEIAVACLGEKEVEKRLRKLK